MENRERLFIYDRKEMIVLVFLGVLVALFAFTLGVHLGKRVVSSGGLPAGEHGDPHAAAEHGAPAHPTSVDTAPDQIPNRQELAEQSKGAPQAADETLNQALHDEVARTGIKMDTPRQVELPQDTKSATGGATTLEKPPVVAHPKEAAKETPKEAAPKTESHSATDHSTDAASKEEEPEQEESQGAGKYSIQVGSYSEAGEAQNQMKLLSSKGLRPFVRSVELQNKGKWYRVYIGNFETKEDAEKTGARYKAQGKVQSFIISIPAGQSGH